MQRWEHRYLGWTRFPDPMPSLDIDQFFTLDPTELAAACSPRLPLHQLAVAVQIGFVRMTGTTLSSLHVVPSAVLEHVGAQLGSPPVHIATIRSLYPKRRTLYDHQAAALKALDYSALPTGARSGLTAYLRREALAVFGADELLRLARVWLADHRYLQPRTRTLRSLVAAARGHQEQRLADAINKAVDPKVLAIWAPRLSAPSPDDGLSHLEWLRTVPAGKAAGSIDDQLARIALLRELGAEALVLPELPMAALEHFARPMLTRKAAILPRLKEPRRTLAVACFLRLMLLRLTDAAIERLDHRIADLWRAARERAEASQVGQLGRFRRLMIDIEALVIDDSIAPAELRDQLRTLIAPFVPERTSSMMAATRRELATRSGDLERLLKQARGLNLDLPADHPVARAFAVLDGIAASDAKELPAKPDQPFGSTWASLIHQADRAAALGSFQAAAAMSLKRGLRNRSVTAPHSLSHRGPEDELITPQLWARDRARFVRDLGVPESCDKYLQRLEAGLAAGLEALAEAVKAGVVGIAADGLRVPRAKNEEDPLVSPARRLLDRAIGSAQLPEVLVEVDALTRFSWVLLNRPPRSESELVTLYAALLALGSDHSAADLVRMVPSLGADAIGQMMARIEACSQLPEASAAVLAFMHGHRIAKLWGPGLAASADMMSLDATRHLWAARIDPRRRTYAVGSYTHVLDQWGIIYDQPIVLNRRQAGAAIEGALRHQQFDLERVAVDTHGFTHFAMALAKLTGFDLCPRLARLKTRKLYLPRGLSVPDVLQPIVAETVSRRAIGRGWDRLLRLASSVKLGWSSATTALDRYGAAMRGDPVYEAGQGIGKLLRTLYLCDYLGSPAFRTGVLDLLNQGEAVHVLQRAIHHGTIAAKRGRTPEQLSAISGALTLIANIVMAWNTHRMSQAIDATPAAWPDDVVAHLAPVSHRHINMRGILTFHLGRHRPALLDERGTLRQAEG